MELTDVSVTPFEKRFTKWCYFTQTLILWVIYFLLLLLIDGYKLGWIKANWMCCCACWGIRRDQYSCIWVSISNCSTLIWSISPEPKYWYEFQHGMAKHHLIWILKINMVRVEKVLFTKEVYFTLNIYFQINRELNQ